MTKDRRYRANRSVLYKGCVEKDPMHHKKGKAFMEAFDEAFGLEPL